MQTGVNEKNGEQLKNQLEHLNVHLSNMNIKELMDKFDTQGEKNFEFQFLKIYIDMVSILFDLIYAPRARNWIMHYRL